MTMTIPLSRSTTTRRAPAVLLYVFLAAGGLWHVLGLFRTSMSKMAGPLISGLALSAAGSAWAVIPGPLRPLFWIWAAFVVLVGWGVERVGVATGQPFGRYRYGRVLQPQVAGVPIAIGFAWLGMLLGSLALAQRAVPARWMARPAPRALATAAWMVLFDRLMEPVAVKLGYWCWDKDDIPVRNYLAWYVLGALFTAAGTSAGVGSARLPAWVMHTWLAQALYFIIVYFAPTPEDAE